jgi:hypothetical protein
MSDEVTKQFHLILPIQTHKHSIITITLLLYIGNPTFRVHGLIVSLRRTLLETMPQEFFQNLLSFGGPRRTGDRSVHSNSVATYDELERLVVTA